VRILITGATGFVGGHLVELLRAEGGHELVGFSRGAAWPADWVHLTGAARLYAGELTDRNVLDDCLRQTRPEWIIHLAGYANTGRSFHEPDACWSDNLTATRSLYDAVARSDASPRILFISSGLVYGDPRGGDEAFDETAPLRPASPYAASKAAADLLGYQVTRSPGLDVVRVRPFNQIGPRQSADYAVANFARQIAAVERGVQPPVITTGDLSARRDLTDVRDMVAAYRLLVEKGVRGEVYNAGCGTTYRIGDILTRLVELSGVRVEIRPTPDPNRAGDTGVSRADSTRLRAATGWTPRVPLDQTLRDVLAYWRGIAARPIP
jgi:GDP-4-dehydro-6-deoxy-D-mannose reductase